MEKNEMDFSFARDATSSRDIPACGFAKVLRFPKAKKAAVAAKAAIFPRQLEVPPALLHMLVLQRTMFGWRRGSSPRPWLAIALHHASCRLSARRRSAELAPLLKAWGFRPRRILAAVEGDAKVLDLAAYVVAMSRMLQDWLEHTAPGVGDDLRSLCAGHRARIGAGPWLDVHWPVVDKVGDVLTIRNHRDGRPRLYGGGLDVPKERRGRPMRDYAAVPAPLEHVLAAASKVEGVHPWTTALTLLAVSERRLHLGRSPDTADVAWALGIGDDGALAEKADNARGTLRERLTALRKAGLVKADGAGGRSRWSVAKGEGVWGWKPQRRAKKAKKAETAADSKAGRKVPVAPESGIFDLDDVERMTDEALEGVR